MKTRSWTTLDIVRVLKIIDITLRATNNNIEQLEPYGDYLTARQIGKAIATQIETQIITSKKNEEGRQNEVEKMRLEMKENCNYKWKKRG